MKNSTCDYNKIYQYQIYVCTLPGKIKTYIFAVVPVEVFH